jgi:ATP-dependent RNA helicase RhlE
MEATGDAFTFVSPEEEPDIRQIEHALGKRLPRVVLPDFDYNARQEERLEVPIGERIAAIRARKAEDRARAKAKADRRAPSGRHTGPSSSRPGFKSSGPGLSGGRRPSFARRPRKRPPRR